MYFIFQFAYYSLFNGVINYYQRVIYPLGEMRETVHEFRRNFRAMHILQSTSGLRVLDGQQINHQICLQC